MVNLTFFGGINEIGGNKILLEDKDTRVFLDFGTSFSKEGVYFEWPELRPTNIEDLFKTNVLPRFNNFYRFSRGKPFVDAILLSHAHMDHYGYLPLIREDIPIWTGRYSRDLIKIRNRTYNQTWERKIGHLEFKEIKTGKDVVIKDITVDPFAVDHSVPGAHAFIIHTSAGTIVYTGDFRISGFMNVLTKAFVKHLKNEDIKCMICEGTNLAKEPREADKHKLPTEKDVERKIDFIMGKTDDLIIYDGSSVDLDRVRTVAEVAKKHGRKLIIESRLAYILLETEKTGLLEGLPGRGDFLVYLNRLRQRGTDEYVEVFSEGRSNYEKKMIEDPELAEEWFIWGPDGREKILKNPEEYLLYTTNGISTMIQFKPVDKDVPGTYVYGKAEPYSEEEVFTYERLKNWIKLCGLKMKFAHTSGHCSPEQLSGILKEVCPEILIPVHSEFPSLFLELIDEKMTRIKLAKEGKRIEIK
ncbi:MAG: MBL fold metallo-hydrolase [Candidatus Aenigmarchaeota archaeon]|nr:MBL fold metallo-hydrolase [Candidatus Aenigmarchaeota archaeon]